MPGFDELYTSDAKKLFDSNDAELLVPGNGLSIGFCVSSAEENRLDKTAFLSAYEWIGGTLREESSIIAPTITVEHEGFPNWNYAYIPNFNRYYFITDIVSVRLNLWRISFRVDPLMSFMDHIKGSVALIERNEFTFDEEVLDDSYPAKYFKVVSENDVVNVDGFVPSIEFKTDVDMTTRPHVAVTTLNSKEQNTNNDYFSPDPGYLPQIKGNNFVAGLMYKTYAMDTVDLRSLAADIINNDAHASYIVSAVVFPYELMTWEPADSSFTWKDVYVGNDRVRLFDSQYPLKCRTVMSPFIAYGTFAQFRLPMTYSFLDFEPYTTRELYIPYCGWFKLPFEACRGDVISVYYSIDQIMGSATAYVYDLTKHRMLWSSPCQLGTKITLGTTNALENKKTEDSNLLNLIMSSIGAGASFGIGAVSGNPVAMVGGVLSQTNAIAGFIDKSNHIIDRAQATAASATTGLSSYQRCRLRVTKVDSVASGYGESFAHQLGKPLRRVYGIGAMSGFTMVSSVHLEIPGAYPSEVNEVESILKEGFIA